MRIAALLVALAACGSPHHGPDGGAGDDGADAVDGPPIDVPFVRGTVKVTVTNASVALCNLSQLHVVFIDVDQTTTDLVADAQGKAQADVFPGASVTAVCQRTTGTTQIAVTVQDVEPGDDITLDGAYFFTGAKTADQTSAGTMKISFPAASSPGYTVETPCGEVGTTQTNNVAMPMKAGCELATMDLVVTTQTQWTEAANVAFANNGSVTVSDAWHAMAPIAASYSNAPAFCADSTDADYPCNAQLARYVPELHGHRTMTSAAIASSASLMVTSPTSSRAIMQTLLTTNGPEYQIFTDAVDGTQTSYMLDVAARELPWMCRKTAQCPSFSGTAAKLAIPVVGTGNYDLFETDVQFTRAPQNTQIFIWRVFGPTAGDVTLPTLPASVATINPTPQDHQSVTHARICESDALTGWRAARQNPFDSLGTCLQSTNPTAPRYGGAHNRVSASQ
ncbi:MAG: hypothetical protein JO257_17040 [Deltaproteobacteria bacterium]|nr:hypothetical protein [Deltaproteobacteria bacterium]